MTQVKAHGQLLALAAPPLFSPPPQPAPPASAATSSFFEDISLLEEHTSNGNDPLPTSTAKASYGSSPSLPPNATLTPVQLVALSNMKLNNDMFSSRSLSIHRRILVKNMLTLLYQLNPPMDWPHMQLEMMEEIEYGDDDFTPIPLALDEEPPEMPSDDKNMLLREDEQKGWMERTLSAAGLSENDDTDMVPQKQDTNPFSIMKAKSTSTSSPTSNTPLLLLPPIATSSILSTTSLSSSSLCPGTGNNLGEPFPRPKSSELPQSLHSYLSTVFDVNWSVELTSKEDLLFTAGSPAPSPGSSSGSSVSSSASLSPPSSVVSKRKSIIVASGLSTVSNALGSGHDSISSAPSISRTTLSTSSSASSTSSVASMSSTGSAIYGISGSGTASGGPRPASAGTTLVVKSLSSMDSSRSNGGFVIGNNAASGINHYGKNMPVRMTSTNGHGKQVLVPGRRSSLLQAGQLLTPPIPPPKSPPATYNITSNNNNLASSGLLTPPQSLGSVSQSSMASSTTLSSPKPTFSKRSSSLPSERPLYNQRALSNESHLSVPSTMTATTTIATTLSVPQANIIGLPRPLLNPAGMSTSASLLPSSLSSPTIPSPTTFPGQPSPSSSPSSLPMTQTHSYSPSMSDDQVLQHPGSHLTGTSSSSSLISKESGTYNTILSSLPPRYHLKASKSSPCLVSGYEDDAQDDLLSSAIPPAPAMPNRYLPSNLSHPPVGFTSSSSSSSSSSGPGSPPTGVKSLERMSTRRAMSGPSPSTGGAVLMSNHPYEGRHHHHHQQRRGSFEHSQSLHVNMMTGTGGAGMHNHNRTRGNHATVEKPATTTTGRWNSMKTMLGLRAGAKG